MRKIILSGALLFLAACTTSVAVQSDVSAAVFALTTAERVALIYTSLPRCPAPAPCSSPAVVSQIKSLDNTAYSTVKAAEANSALLSAALAAIANLQTAIPVTQ